MMIWNPRLWLCLPGLAALVVCALAAQPPDDGDGFAPRFGPPPDPLSFALDTDRDGEISAAETRRAPEILRGLDRADVESSNEDSLETSTNGFLRSSCTQRIVI